MKKIKQTSRHSAPPCNSSRIKKIKFGIPSGTLNEPIKKLFQKAGYDFEINEKSSAIYIDDPEINCFFARVGELPPLIKKGMLDGGIVSRVSLAESKTELKEICNFGHLLSSTGETRLVLAVPEKSHINSLKDLKGKKVLTRVPEITKEFFKKNKVPVIIEFSDGTNETKVPSFSDALVEFTNTGATLKYFNFKILAVLMKDSVILVANENSLKNNWKREKIENLAMLLEGTKLAQGYAGLMLHASNDMMERVLKVLPALKKPTVTHLRGENWFDVLTIANKIEIRKIIPKLKKIGCSDIVEFPLNKVVL